MKQGNRQLPYPQKKDDRHKGRPDLLPGGSHGRYFSVSLSMLMPFGLWAILICEMTLGLPASIKASCI
ncbi:hypothetical protein D3C81_2258050 [compost metagenome]